VKANHPVRKLVAQVVAGEQDEDALLESGEAVAEASKPSWSDLGASANYVASTIAGVVDGMTARRDKPDAPSNASQAGLHTSRSLADKFHDAQKSTSSYLAIAGISSPPNADELQTQIDGVVAKAEANKEAIAADPTLRAFPTLDEVTKLAKGLVGLNKGDDSIQQVRTTMESFEGRDRKFNVHAFDRRGYHVMWAKCLDGGKGVLAIESLRASHGRNCDSFKLAPGKRGVPGRGNAAVTAAALEAVVLEAVNSGVHTLRTSPGSPAVSRLYAKMGFKFANDSDSYHRHPVEWALETIPLVRRWDDAKRVVHKIDDMNSDTPDTAFSMVLDLTDPAAVRQALVAFQLSRGAVDDVPKNVADRMSAMGETPSEPAFLDWATRPGTEHEQIVGPDPPTD